MLVEKNTNIIYREMQEDIDACLHFWSNGMARTWRRRAAIGQDPGASPSLPGLGGLSARIAAVGILE